MEKEDIVLRSGKVSHILFTVLSVFILIIGFYIGYNMNSFSENNNQIIVDGEDYIIRRSDGGIVKPIEKNDIIYLPVNELGSYLDYMTIVDEKGLSLYQVEDTNLKILSELNTETINGEKIDSSIFKNADYTVMFLWATHCKYCKDTISDFVTLNSYIEKSNIQFYSIVSDLEYLELKNDILQEDIDNVNNIIGDLNITDTLLVDKVIEKELIGSSVSLPKLFIFDKYGNLVKILDKTITSKQFIELFDILMGGD